MNKQNNLSELNEILFNTLRKLENKEIDLDQARAVSNMGNTIINNAKVQLDAYKLTGGKTGTHLFGPNDNHGHQAIAEQNEGPKTKKIRLPHNTYDRQELYAVSLGYKSPGAAIAELGKDDFILGFGAWVKFQLENK